MTTEQSTGEGSPEENKSFPKEVKVVVPDPVVDAKEGFIQPPGFLALGREEDLLIGMRARGWSEDALKALKSGKAIIRNFVPTPFGTHIEEDWLGKDKENKAE